MYLDISFGWRQRADIQRLRLRRRRNSLRLLVAVMLAILGCALVFWRWT